MLRGTAVRLINYAQTDNILNGNQKYIRSDISYSSFSNKNAGNCNTRPQSFPSDILQYIAYFILLKQKGTEAQGR